MFKQTNNPFEEKVRNLPSIKKRPKQYHTPPKGERPIGPKYNSCTTLVPYIRKERNRSNSWIWVPIAGFLAIAGYFLFTIHKDKIIELLERLREKKDNV